MDWNQPADIINRHIRVHARPYQPAKALLGDKWYFINRATAISHVPARPGTMIGPMTVACGQGALVIEEMQPCEK